MAGARDDAAAGPSCPAGAAARMSAQHHHHQKRARTSLGFGQPLSPELMGAMGAAPCVVSTADLVDGGLRLCGEAVECSGLLRELILTDGGSERAPLPLTTQQIVSWAEYVAAGASKRRMHLDVHGCARLAAVLEVRRRAAAAFAPSRGFAAYAPDDATPRS